MWLVAVVRWNVAAYLGRSQRAILYLRRFSQYSSSIYPLLRVLFLAPSQYLHSAPRARNKYILNPAICASPFTRIQSLCVGRERKRGVTIYLQAADLYEYYFSSNKVYIGEWRRLLSCICFACVEPSN